MNSLRPLEHWNREFEPDSKHGCLPAFILRLCCFVFVVTLRLAVPPSKESYRLCFTDALCSTLKATGERVDTYTCRIKSREKVKFNEDPLEEGNLPKQQSDIS